jgi:hypothetical protein
MASLSEIIDVHPHHHESRIAGADGQAAALVDRTVFITDGCEWNRRISLIVA